jgi:SAM-dependent methyltransferase
MIGLPEQAPAAIRKGNIVTTEISSEELRRLYWNRFQARQEGRKRIWQVLAADFFQQWISPNDVVLDLGAGYGEFLQSIKARRKLGVDANPQAAEFWEKDIEPLHFDVTSKWQVPPGSIDCVFTSNFFEHLPDKRCLERCVNQVFLALKPGGILIALGPNIRKTGGSYWDFFDHFIALTERSLCELLSLQGFRIDYCKAGFLFYTMSRSNPMVLTRVYPILMRVYLRCPFVWPLFGRQFIVVASKPASGDAQTAAPAGCP